MLGNSDFLVLDAAHLDSRAQDYSLVLEIFNPSFGNDSSVLFVLHTNNNPSKPDVLLFGGRKIVTGYYFFALALLETPGLILY